MHQSIARFISLVLLQVLSCLVSCQHHTPLCSISIIKHIAYNYLSIFTSQLHHCNHQFGSIWAASPIINTEMWVHFTSCQSCWACQLFITQEANAINWFSSRSLSCPAFQSLVNYQHHSYSALISIIEHIVDISLCLHFNTDTSYRNEHALHCDRHLSPAWTQYIIPASYSPQLRKK